MTKTARDDGKLEREIEELLADPAYAGHPVRAALAQLYEQYSDGLSQLERLTSISDGYQSVLQQRSDSMGERYRKQIKQLHRIVSISDHYQEMLRSANDALRVASSQDILTGLANRRFMVDRLEAEVARVERSGKSFTIALVDADEFKRINDDFGHDIGDFALICLGRSLVSGLRSYDVCARWGGEEFMVFLPETDVDSAVEIIDRLRQAVRELHPSELPAEVCLSISAGVTEHVLGQSLTETIKRADHALYEAKACGRNRVHKAVWLQSQ